MSIGCPFTSNCEFFISTLRKPTSRVTLSTAFLQAFRVVMRSWYRLGVSALQRAGFSILPLQQAPLPYTFSVLESTLPSGAVSS